MEKQGQPFWKRWLASLTGLLIWYGTMAALPTKQQAFVKAHIFLVFFLPLVLIFLIFACRFYYLEYKQ